MANVSTKMVDILVSCSISGIMSTVATYTKPPAINPCTSFLHQYKHVFTNRHPDPDQDKGINRDSDQPQS